MNNERLMVLAARAIGMIGNEWGKTSEEVWNWLDDDQEFELYLKDYEPDLAKHQYDEIIPFVISKLKVKCKSCLGFGHNLPECAGDYMACMSPCDDCKGKGFNWITK